MTKVFELFLRHETVQRLVRNGTIEKLVLLLEVLEKFVIKVNIENVSIFIF